MWLGDSWRRFFVNSIKLLLVCFIANTQKGSISQDMYLITVSGISIRREILLDRKLKTELHNERPIKKEMRFALMKHSRWER